MVTSEIRAHAVRAGESTALLCGAATLTYTGLVNEIDRVVARLAALGIDRSKPVAALCENCAEIMLFYYAVASIGGTFIPVNPSLTSPEVAYILSHASVELLLHDKKMAPVATEAGNQHPATRLMDLHVFSAEKLDAAPVSEEVSQENFLIVYTSGSTGKPKAVVFDQTAEVAGNRALIDLWGLNDSDVTVVALPLGFLYGLSTATAAALQAGGRAVILRRFHPRDVLEAFVQHKATVFQGVPTMFTMMLEYAEQNDIKVDLSFMRLLISAGAPLSRELRARFERRFNKCIDDYYAMTEARPIFGRYFNDNAPVPEGAIGKAAPGVFVRIVNESGRDVLPGQTGELLVRAPSTTRGYMKNEALSKELFADGMLRTGDLGYRDSQGYYYLTGRKKDIIIRGGANVAPAEIEEVLASHPDVQNVAVIGIPDEKFGQLVAAHVVARGEAALNESALRDFCKGQLADFKIPSHFILVKGLPLGITGKVDKAALLKYWLEGRP
jgi:long-chain acyl-CoA synthetase